MKEYGKLAKIAVGFLPFFYGCNATPTSSGSKPIVTPTGQYASDFDNKRLDLIAGNEATFDFNVYDKDGDLDRLVADIIVNDASSFSYDIRDSNGNSVEHKNNLTNGQYSLNVQGADGEGACFKFWAADEKGHKSSTHVMFVTFDYGLSQDNDNSGDGDENNDSPQNNTNGDSNDNTGGNDNLGDIVNDNFYNTNTGVDENDNTVYGDFNGNGNLNGNYQDGNNNANGGNQNTDGDSNGNTGGNDNNGNGDNDNVPSNDNIAQTCLLEDIVRSNLGQKDMQFYYADVYPCGTTQLPCDPNDYCKRSTITTNLGETREVIVSVDQYCQNVSISATLSETEPLDDANATVEIIEENDGRARLLVTANQEGTSNFEIRADGETSEGDDVSYEEFLKVTGEYQ